MDFKEAFGNYLDIVNKIILDNHRQMGFSFEPDKVMFTKGSRYYKVIRTLGTSQRSVFAFVDRETGDIYKPAGWKAPAKHPRGNIFDEKSIHKWTTPYGPAYLK